MAAKDREDPWPRRIVRETTARLWKIIVKTEDPEIVKIIRKTQRLGRSSRRSGDLSSSFVTPSRRHN